MNTTTTTTSASPQLETIPLTSGFRLIDNGMLHHEASVAGLAERYGRGETSHTIHVWWARRPHSAMRALVFASLCKDRTESDYTLMKHLSLSSDPRILEEARTKLQSQYGSSPKILDMFGGGGTIPFEASALGAETYAIDSNELSVFIQSCNLIFSQRVSQDNIQDLVEESGKRVLERLKLSSAPLYPLRDGSTKSVFGYLWTYSLTCTTCGYQFYLSKRPWLSKKKGKNLAIIFSDNDDKQSASIDILHEKDSKNVWVGRSGNVQCPKCASVHQNLDIQNLNDEMIALIKPAMKSGKDFVPAVSNAIPNNDFLLNFEKALLEELNVTLPSSELPRWSGIVNPALYGIRTHSDFLNKRQRIVLLLLIKSLKEEFKSLQEQHDLDTSKYVIGVLSSLIDQLVDWNCRLSMWIPQNEQVGRSFCGPGVSMLWDYVETDPLLNGPANLWGKLDRIVSGVSSINLFPVEPKIRKGFAQKLPFEDSTFDAIVTDPPYYDNIYYTVLADFFYSWKRLLLIDIVPELFSGDETDRKHELVASSFRSNTPQQAHEDYCEQFCLAIGEASRVLKEDGVFTLVYSHSSANGWEAIVRAYRSADLKITSVQPLSIERKHRPRSMTSEAVNTCIAFVAHKYTGPKSSRSIADLCEEVRHLNGLFANSLLNLGWVEEDVALAVFANGVGLLSNVTSLSDCASDLDALQKIANVVSERFSSFKLKNRKPL